MDIARHLALIDELCLRPFPAEHGPSHEGAAGPGHFTAVLESSHGLSGRDPARRAATVEQYEKERDALYERLAPRWGETAPGTCRRSCCAPSGRRYPSRGPP